MKKNIYIIVISFLLCLSTSIVKAFSTLELMSLGSTISNPQNCLILIPDSLYDNIDSIEVQIGIYSLDNNLFNELNSYDAFINDENEFTKLGEVNLNGISYHVYTYNLLFSNLQNLSSYNDLNIGVIIDGFYNEFTIFSIGGVRNCNLQEPLTPSNFLISYVYNFKYRQYLGYQPFSTLTLIEKVEVSKLLNWHFNLQSNGFTIQEFDNAMNSQFLGYSFNRTQKLLPTTFCCVQDVYPMLDSIAQIDTIFNISSFNLESITTTINFCNCFQHYIIKADIIEEGQEFKLYLIPIVSYFPTWVLHLVNGEGYQIAYSYQYEDGMDGLYSSSIFDNNEFVLNDFKIWNGY